MTTSETRGFLFAIVLALTLGAGSAWAWHAAGQGTGLSSDMDGISMRDQGSSRVRGGRVYVGGGLRGGK